MCLSNNILIDIRTKWKYLTEVSFTDKKHLLLVDFPLKSLTVAHMFIIMLSE